LRIVRADLYRISVPFQFVFAHAAAERSESDNLILKLTLSDGVCGYGECLARIYVTGDSAADVCAWFDRHAAELLRGLVFETPEGFAAFLRNPQNELPPGPAGCLLELALLDAFGKSLKLSARDIFARQTQTCCVYAGVVGKMNGLIRRQILARMQKGGLKYFKVKVGFGKADRDALRDCREIAGGDVTIGLDANSAWAPEEALDRLADLAEFRPAFVEQPVRREDTNGLHEVARQSSIPVILDESVCTPEEAEMAVRCRLGHGFSLRLSKMGGLARTLLIHDLARAAGLRCHMGAMVGETGILAAAGRHLATMTKPEFLEGSFGDLLLREDLTVPSVRFGKEGRGPAIEGYGLGVEVDPKRIEKYRKSHREYAL
jgi:L-alanine-DL-glutamate epimerase-like enolase superfamily enzyme